MSHVTLVRHGQANTEARDEDSYDRLSDLGHQQARWLGDHFQASGERFARVYSGTLRRHRETAAGLGAQNHAEVIEDARLNELEYFTMAALYQDQFQRPLPEDREDFAEHMPALFEAWEDGSLKGAPESHADFAERVTGVIHDIAAGDGRALVVTSGGVIGMTLSVTMGLQMRQMSRTTLMILNTSLHRFQPLGGALSLSQFNAVPHLEHPERQFAQTHI